MKLPISLALTTALALATAAHADELVLPRPSSSAKLTATAGITSVTVDYSSPAVKGRKVFGELVPFGQVWRTGANASTKLTFSTDVTIDGKTVPAGTYAFYAIPTAAAWTLILSKDLTLWGSDGYKAESDQLRVQATPSAIPHREHLAYEVLDAGDEGATVALEWGTVRVGFAFKVDTAALVLKELRAFKSDDWKAYNSAARYLLANKLEPALAMELTDKSIKLNEAWFNDFTKAELLVAKGDKKAAQALAPKIQELGKKDPNFDSARVSKAIAEWK
jgi:Protein of unknown function (DUF2911)